MTDQWTDRLSEYLDQELEPADREQVEAHLATCPDCRQVLQELRAVVARAGRLKDREPRSDLWAGVQSAIGRGRVVDLDSRRISARRFSFSLPQLVAAAAALALVSGGSAWMMSQRGDDARAVAEAPPAPGVQAQPVRFDRKGRADSAITELERILLEESGRLDSSTVRILTQNLALIDRAIGQARKALESDPSNPYLNDHLARTMRKKIEVLRHAADLAQVAS
jgi:anti-sigma factor RsiW